MLLLLLLLLLMSTSAKKCELLKPRNLSFYSLDLNTTLTWMPPENAEGVFYTVTYLEYGSDIWYTKLECTKITWTWCNLANETNNYLLTYYGNVTVHSRDCSISEVSEGFQPRFQTVLGPPRVSLFSTANSILINLTQPVVEKVPTQFKYHIYLNNVHIKETKVSYYEKEHLEAHTKYCITAKLSVFGRESSMSNTTCITTKSDYILIWLKCILPLVLATLTLSFITYAVHKYIYVNNPNQPNVLNTISRNSTNGTVLEAYPVPINIVIIDAGKKIFQDTVICDKDYLLKKSFIDLAYPEEDLNQKSNITDEGNCYGFGKCQDTVPNAKPNISTYDMPHWTLDSPVSNQDP
ncbi:interleukin-20 receptor subunit alpha-like [Pyxicephalus adspersus]|uniref:interleukin-20 receptor subunit alpha-like n=1 Tax=Pyxicephalus adspersus TaxID=30357 RepID=UPI003B5908D3